VGRAGAWFYVSACGLCASEGVRVCLGLFVCVQLVVVVVVVGVVVVGVVVAAVVPGVSSVAVLTW